MTNRIARLEAKLEAIKQELEELKTEELKGERQYPKEGTKGWSLRSDGIVYKDSWTGLDFDIQAFDQGNWFYMREQAEAEKMRRESRAKAWKPNKDEQYYYADRDGNVQLTSWGGWNADFGLYHTGNCHKTKKEAKVWYKRYGKYFFEI